MKRNPNYRRLKEIIRNNRKVKIMLIHTDNLNSWEYDIYASFNIGPKTLNQLGKSYYQKLALKNKSSFKPS